MPNTISCLTESAARKLKHLVWWQISNTRGELAIDMEVLHDGYIEHIYYKLHNQYADLK